MSAEHDLTTKERLVLRKLAELGPGWIPRRALKASVDFMQDLYFRGLVYGCGTRDHRGYGNTPDTNLWRLTAKGAAAVEAFARTSKS